MPPTFKSEYQELVDAPNETLEVEYKSWLDLSENGARADLARHIAAIANSGGGDIVFGFDDQLQRDTVFAIVRKHLEPNGCKACKRSPVLARQLIE
jgi:predicted HTH transcriptional regulator